MQASGAKGRESDPRFQRSLDALLGAVTALVDAGPIQQISITRIVAAAGVTRPTFYQHFPDVPTAAQRAALARLDGIFPETLPLPPETVVSAALLSARIEAHAMPVLEHLYAHRDFYVRVVDGAASAGFFDELVGFVAAHLLPESLDLLARSGTARRQDLIAVLAGGNMWMVVRWLRGGCIEAPVELARRMSGIVAALVQ